MNPDCYDFYLWSIGKLPIHLFDPYAEIEADDEGMND